MNSSISIDLSNFFKITSFTLILFSLFYLGSRYSSGSQQLTFFSFQESSSAVVVLSPNSVNQSDSVQYTDEESQLFGSSPPPLPSPGFHNTGIVDGNGMMTAEFEAEQLQQDSDENFQNYSAKHGGNSDEKRFRVKSEKFEVCGVGMTEFIPCLDNVEAIMKLNSTEKGERYERHCPESGKALKCLIPAPHGYRTPIQWPQSRDEVWFSNVPHMRLVEDKGGQNWISRNGDKFIFPGGGTQFIHGAEQYLDHIAEMVPMIGFGLRSRVALDVGCGVASFGAYLMKRNVSTMSIAPKDVHENQIQFALERGVPAMVSAFATRRLPYPSQAFDFVHCSRCRINWTRDDGILLLEVDRMVRAGGYFVWAAQPVYKHEENLQKQWREMDNLTKSICWELVKKDGYIAIWRKPVDNMCYLSRSRVGPPSCDRDDDPDNVWYRNLKACITLLPENGYGLNITTWPARLHSPPDRLQSISLDSFISRKEIFRAEMKYWNEIIGSYINAYHWKQLNLRNVMDMRAGFGGFAVALHDLGIDCWVMNVVPVSGFNTLPVIYDRGLVGVMHDWCEPFDTYPRTYDLLHAMGLFSTERKRCHTWKILLEMDRMLRPGGRVYIRDSVTVIHELEDIVHEIEWSCALHETGEGPHSSLKILLCVKHRH